MEATEMRRSTLQRKDRDELTQIAEALGRIIFDWLQAQRRPPRHGNGTGDAQRKNRRA